jgi:hypothetical protein
MHAVGGGEARPVARRGRMGGRVDGRAGGRTRINLGSAGAGAGAVNSGNNRMSLTKDRLTTLGDHALVFSELRQVTCGVVVQKAVDNRRDMRITGRILWTTCGRRKKSE